MGLQRALKKGQGESFRRAGSMSGHDDKSLTRARGLKGRFEQLPKEEQDALHGVFELYDVDKSGMLDKDELRKALYEIGLHGINAPERRTLARLCEEKMH